MIGIFVSFFIGTFIGVCVASLCVACQDPCECQQNLSTEQKYNQMSLSDCEYNYQFSNTRVHINDGHIVNICKEEE